MTTQNQTPPVLKFLQIIIAVLLFFAIIGWLDIESILSIDIRIGIIAWLVHPACALVALTLLVGTLFFIHMRYGERWQALSMMLVPLPLLILFLFSSLACLTVPVFTWQDEALFKKDKEILIYQKSYDGDMPIVRVIKTGSQYSFVRSIRHLDNRCGTLNVFSQLRNKVIYEGAVWTKIKNEQQ